MTYKSVNTATGCPKDYAELYECYFPMIKSIVVKWGIDSRDVEDVAMELLTKFMERDALAWYNPDLLHDVGDNPRLPGQKMRPAKFQGLLRRFCDLYVRQEWDKQKNLRRREVVRLEAPVSGEEGGSTWGEIAGEASSDGGLSSAEIRSVTTTAFIAALRHLYSQEMHWAERASNTTWHHEKQYAMRRAVEAHRAQEALRDAVGFSSGEFHAATCDGDPSCRCERVSAVGIARREGWSASSASVALRQAREALRATLSA